MKKNKFTEFFKGKGYYVLLFVGVIAIAAVAFVGSSLSSSQKPNTDNSVDLNESDNNNIAANDNSNQTANNQTSNEVANKDQTGNTTNDVTTKDNDEQKVASNDNAIELEGYDEETAKADNKTGTAQAKEEEPATVETSGKTVQADASSSLSFKADDGLLWPVTGDVIMNYSMDHTIYHATLMEYKCNPAIIIGAKVGTNVKAAAKGIVEKIDTENEETGYTVTVNIGNGYSVIYGQLKDVKLKVGDKVNEGDTIGMIAEPTKYYTVEGSNLYFEVMKDDKTVNPMLLLRENE